jgi:hypothetical protein
MKAHPHIYTAALPGYAKFSVARRGLTRQEEAC